MPENFEAWELWNACSTQWRVGMGGLVGLDYNVLFKMADFLEITIDDEMMKKITALEYNCLKSCMPKEGAKNV